jgi:hypothetical protein
MAPRVQLQTLLESLLGSTNVYFQPPPSMLLKYPCIVYERDNVDIKYAGNVPYSHAKRYSVTVMDLNPDSEIPDRISKLPTSSFSRHFKSDNLNHDVYTLYF